MRKSLKQLNEMTEMIKANHLIQQIWGEENGITPYLLMAHSQVGGLVLGAQVDGDLVAVSYGFPGLDGNEPFLYSHLLAVMPQYRGSNIGADLKELQAQLAREMGYTKLKWTFDPLQSKNAYLNIHKLKATSRTYKMNFYGEMKDELNAGSPTDRLIVEWDLTGKNPEFHPELAFESYVQAATEEWDEEWQFPRCSTWTETDAACVAVPVPTNIARIREGFPSDLNRWRVQLREMFNYYFDHGYFIHGFHYVPHRPVQYYLLRHENRQIGEDEAYGISAT